MASGTSSGLGADQVPLTLRDNVAEASEGVDLHPLPSGTGGGAGGPAQTPSSLLLSLGTASCLISLGSKGAAAGTTYCPTTTTMELGQGLEVRGPSCCSLSYSSERCSSTCNFFLATILLRQLLSGAFLWSSCCSGDDSGIFLRPDSSSRLIPCRRSKHRGGVMAGHEMGGEKLFLGRNNQGGGGTSTAGLYNHIWVYSQPLVL